MTVTVQVSHQVETPVVDLPRTWTRERRTAVGLMAIGCWRRFGLLAGDKPVRFTFGETTSGSGVTLDPVVGRWGSGCWGGDRGQPVVVHAPMVRLAGAASLLPVVGSFLCWQLSNAALNTLPLGQVLRSSLLLALPLIFGGLAGVVGSAPGHQHRGRGQFLAGAFAGRWWRPWRPVCGRHPGAALAGC